MRNISSVIFSLFLYFPVNAGIFDSLAMIPAGQRINKAEEIYFNRIRLSDSLFAFTELNDFLALARRINDPALESVSYSMRADKIARLRGFNEQSVQLHLKAVAIAQTNNLALATAVAEFKTGRFYYSFQKYPPAFEHLLKADDFLAHIKNLGTKQKVYVI